MQLNPQTAKLPIFYVYAYCDSRIKFNKYVHGCYFEFLPFYIGKGKNKRWMDHLSESKKIRSKVGHKVYKIRKLESINSLKIVKLKIGIINDEAVSLEKLLIKFFGKRVDRSGILVNISDGGDNPILFGEANGFYGKKHSQDTLDKIIVKYKLWYYSLSAEDKKAFNKKKGERTSIAWKSFSIDKLNTLYQKRRDTRLINRLKNDPDYLIKKTKKEEIYKLYKIEKEEKRLAKFNRFSLAKLTLEDRSSWYKENRSGDKNPNWGKGDNIKNENNPIAKCYKITIGIWTFIVHGRRKQFGKEFKQYFKCNDPLRGKTFQQIYSIFDEEIIPQESYPDNWIIYKDASSFERLKNEKFTKHKNYGQRRD